MPSFLDFFFSSIIQTTTYFEIAVSSTYDVSNGNTQEGYKTSGSIYLVTMGKNKDGTNGTEEQSWVELTGDKPNTVEEMNEKSHDPWLVRSIRPQI